MKTIRGVAVLVGFFLFAVSITQAPWSCQRDRYRFQTYFQPLWQPPDSSSVVSAARLRLEILAVEWLAIGLAVTTVFFVTRRNTNEKPPPPRLA